jgi:hypothetical protein
MQQHTADPAGEHVAGTAAVNVVTAAQFAEVHPTSEVGRWAMSRTSKARGTVLKAPKAVVQFSMADEASRRDARGEIDPTIWKALEVEREGRKAAMVAELVEALGEAAREQTKKHVNALMAFQLSRAMKPRELARLKPAEGSLGGAVQARSVSVEGAATLMGEVMAAGFPEFDWGPLSKLAHMVGRMLQLPGPAALRRASEIYDWGLKQLQDAGRAARDDTSDERLSLVEGADFNSQLRGRVRALVESHDQHQADMEDLRRVAGESPQKAQAGLNGGGGGGGNGGLSQAGGAIGRALGDPAMTVDRVKEVRSSFLSDFPAKCLYAALLGTCNPTAGKTCPVSHDGLPSKAQLSVWAAKLGYKL